MNIVILGACSGIAMEIGRIYAARGDALGLLDIKAEDLEANRKDFLVRGAAKAKAVALDLLHGFRRGLRLDRDDPEEQGKGKKRYLFNQRPEGHFFPEPIIDQQ